MNGSQIVRNALYNGIMYPPTTDAIAMREWFPKRLIQSPVIFDQTTFEEDANHLFDWGRFTRLVVPFEHSFLVEWRQGGFAQGAFVSPIRMPADSEGLRDWRLRIIGISSHPGVAPQIICSSMIGIAANGELCGAATNGLQHFSTPETYYATERTFEGKSATDQDVHSTIIEVCLNVLLLLGCRNVDLSPREADEKFVRAARKRLGASSTGYRYHVLTVRPTGSKPGTPGVEIGTMPRHFCRGHFSEYGPEFNKGLLFGKHAGRFFVPPHLKGDAKNGVIDKDYAVVGIAS